MAYGTAPHKDARGRWVTQDGRVLTPAGQAWWEHHHQQGLVTRDGHTTQRAKTIAFGKTVTDPTRPILPAPPPPRARPGQPTITRPQWKGMTPKQKMDTQVTVTLTARERAQLKARQDAQVAAARKKGLTVTGIPSIPTKINQPIGFGGASSIDQRMAALDRAEAATRAKYAKEHPPEPSQLERARAQATASGYANFPEARAKVRAYNAAAGPNMFSAVAKGIGMLPVDAIKAVGLDLQAAGVGITRSASGYRSTPGTPEQVKVAQDFLPHVGRQIGENTLGPAITSGLLGGHPSLTGLGIDAALLIPGLKPLRGAKLGIDAARAARAARRAEATAAKLTDKILQNREQLRAAVADPNIRQGAIDSLNAEHAKLTAQLEGLTAEIPERQTQIEQWRRMGFSDAQIDAFTAFHDNQAAHYPKGPKAWWEDRIQHPTGESPAEQRARGAKVLHQETPEARIARAKAAADDAQKPTNANWRDRPEIDIPHDMTKKGFVDLAPVAAAAREANIPDVLFAPEKQRARLIAKLFPQKGTHAGIPTTKNIWKTTEDGMRYKIAGNISPQDWVERVIAVVRDPKLIDSLAHWYTIYRPTFTRAFGEDAPEIMRAFAVSQANASPASGLTAVLKVMDRLAAGNPLTRNEYSVVGLNIQKAVQDKEITSHVAAKLSDFVDSLAGSKTRTWMGHDHRAGSPVAVDVHAIRDRGFIDKKLQAKIEAAGFKLGKDFHLEGNGTATGALYERIAEWYHEIADHLNDIEFNGRKDWTPAQAQALGWSTIQKANGVIPEGFAEAFNYNTRDIGFEVTRGAGDLGADLSQKQTREVAKAMLPHVRALAEDIPGIYVRGIKVDVGGWGSGSNVMVTVKVIGSKQSVQDSLTHFAQAFDQGGVQAAREVSGKDSRAAIVLHSPKFKDPRAKAKFWEALNRHSPVDKRRTIKVGGKKVENPNYGEPLLAGYMPGDEEGVPSIVIRTETRSVSPKTESKFIDKFEEAILKASDEAGFEPGYTARNIELLTGDQNGATNPLQTLPGGWDTRGRAAALEHPRSAGIRDALEREIDRVRGGPAPGAGEPGELVTAGSRLHQLDPAGEPLGATEFLEGGKTRTHYFSGANTSTVMHELFHASIQDLKGSHLTTLADEYAGGRPLHLWTDAEHEAVAEAFENWIRTGEIKNPTLKGAFQAIKEWMLKIAGKTKAEGWHVPADVEEAFNYMFREPGDVARLKKEVLAAAQRAKREVYPLQEAKRSIERGKRFTAMEEARVAAGGGRPGQEAALESLSGEYWKEPFNDLTHLDESDMDYLISAVEGVKRLRGIEKTKLIQALEAANRGEVLRPSDSDLVFKAFGTGKEARKHLTRTQRAMDLLTQIVNIPRSFMSSFDVSGILRQGLMTAVMHPVMSAKLTPQMIRYLLSEEYYLERMARFRADPRYHHLVDEGGLELTDTGHGLEGEEAYQSHVAETLSGLGTYVPGVEKGKYSFVRASGRAYTGLLNDMRWGSATNMYDLALENNMLTGEQLRAIGKVSNWATGRGTLGKHEQSAQLMNLFLFSPRLLSSRLQTFNPWFYKGLDPEQRLFFIRWSARQPAQKQALKATARLFIAGGSILALAKLAGADIELNPRSSDFAKIRVGDTRVDIWGGHQSIVRTFFQTLTRERKVTSTGETKPVGVLDPIFNFFESKASPPFGVALDIHRGHKITGEPNNWMPPWDPLGGIGSRLYPLGVQDTWEAYGQADDIALGALIFALSQVGLSTQTYPADEPGSAGGKKTSSRDWGVAGDTQSPVGGRTNWGVAPDDSGSVGGRTDWGVAP